MDWTAKDIMFRGLFLCATHTSRRGGHAPFVQAGAGTSDTGAEVVKAGPRCAWQVHARRVGDDFGMKVRSLVVFSFSNHPALHQ